MFGYSSLENTIDQLNIVIKEAIDHGGDDGGAYFCNKENLIKEMRKLIEIWDVAFALKIIENDDYPRIEIMKYND